MLKVVNNNYDKWDLLCRVLTGEISEDNPEFLVWLEKDQENKDLFLSLKSDQTGFDIDKIYRNIVSKTNMPVEKTYKKKFYIPVWIRYASIIAFLITSGLSSGLWYYLSQQQDNNTNIAQITPPEIIPGSKKAVLLLSDGSSVPLDSEFEIEEKNGISINNDTTGGRLNYSATKEKPSKVELHTICIPIGGEYELKLADGTQAYLNSGSKLIYPSYFEGDERHIKLEGEAFFDVAHNGQSFIVETDNLELKVLGTSFNISSYGDDTEVATTLVSGSVEVKTKFNKETYLITPGHQLKFNKESKEISQEKVDTEIYTAWIQGKFIFNNQSLNDIFIKLARWYDFSINYSDTDIKKLRFTGSAEKKRSINYLLNQIEKVTDIKFITNGKEVTVTENINPK